jgi:hypothetical protein
LPSAAVVSAALELVSALLSEDESPQPARLSAIIIASTALAALILFIMIPPYKKYSF